MSGLLGKALLHFAFFCVHVLQLLVEFDQLHHVQEVLHKLLIVNSAITVDVSGADEVDDLLLRECEGLEALHAFDKLLGLQESVDVVIVVTENLEELDVLILGDFDTVGFEGAELDELGLAA